MYYVVSIFAFSAQSRGDDIGSVDADLKVNLFDLRTLHMRDFSDSANAYLGKYRSFLNIIAQNLSNPSFVILASNQLNVNFEFSASKANFSMYRGPSNYPG
jgi:hypothetical protein